ncbi:hypothetical protein [Nitrososphaera viennensis]|uniref:hypothetical protein n=1 Tax=Nitrososphaera viennensis TaxID=1034015 RepID=UPI00130EAF63|nr:hypothetical protein [Nitrososphaera viennensis]
MSNVPSSGHFDIEFASIRYNSNNLLLSGMLDGKDDTLQVANHRTKGLVIGALTIALLLAIPAHAAIQQADAISVSSDTTLPSGGSDYCTSSTSDQTILSVTVANSNVKLDVATLAGYVATQGGNNYGNLELKLKTAGVQVDWANIEAQSSDLRDRTAALSWSVTTSSAQTVTARNGDIGSSDTVCVITGTAELFVTY